MRAGMLRTIVIAAVWLYGGAFSVAGEQPQHASTLAHGSTVSSRSMRAPGAALRARRLKTNAALAVHRDRYADPISPYNADRLSRSRQESALNVPGQTTVLTRQILDDMNATSLRDAMRSTAGVTVGR
jgi:outer membrane receptor for monomeric catechols